MIEAHYKKEYKGLAKKAGRILNDIHYGEDATQEAYLLAIKYLPTFNQEKGDFNGWFFRIWKNRVVHYLNFIRDKGVTKDVHKEEAYVPSVLEVNGLFIQEEIAKVGNETHKDILTLFLLKGYTSVEVSQILDVTPNSVNKVISRFKFQVKNDSGSRL